VSATPQRPDCAPAQPRRRARKREKTANHLAATAFRLFEEQGFEAVTMEQIAVAADVAKGTLYNHFPLKEGLLAHQFRQEIASGMVSLRDALERQPGFAARMRFLLRACAEWNESRRAYLPYYLRFRWALVERGDRDATEEHRSGTFHILEALFREGQASGEVRQDVRARDIAWMFEFMLLGAVTVWLSRPGEDLKQGFESSLGVLLEGVTTAARAGKRKK